MHMDFGQSVCLLMLVLVASSQAVHDTSLGLPICGGNVTTEKTDIRSPGYPDPYPGGIDCLWTIIADKGLQIYLTFDQFQVDGDDDLVQVYDEDAEGGRSIIGSFTGNQDRFMILSASNKLQINFTSSNTSSAHLHRRFHATFKTNEKGCGGTFTGAKSGVISSPIYNPDHMPPAPLSCTWQINANKNHKLALSFDDSSLGVAILEVKDGFGSEGPLLANFTGTSMLPDVISTKDQVYVKLTFELESPPKVKATFIEISGECSGHIILTETNTSYQIQSPNFPKPYPNNLDCRWLVESIHEMTTLVAIATAYQVVDTNDELTVHDGASRSANQLWSYRGRIVKDKETPWLVSSSQSMWVKFTTDETENQGYFSLNITLQESGGLVKKTSEAYFPSASLTVYQCFAPTGYQCVFFTTFWNCTFSETGAVISFYEGRWRDPNKLIHRYSANYTEWVDEMAPPFSNGQWMLIVAENLGDGGNCVGSQIKLLDDDSFQHSYGTTGSRLQPPKDTLYNGWVIHPDITRGNLLQLSILKLDLIYEEFISITEVDMGQVSEIMALSKDWNGALTVYITPISPITVAYLNIPEIAGRSLAYSMSYSTLVGCEEHLNSTTKPGYVASPDFPSRYPLNAICTWTINIENNHLLHISFQDIHLSSGHYIEIKSNQQDTSNMGMRLYGKTRPDDMIVVGSSGVQITFNTTARFTHPSKGFKLLYKKIACGGNMTAKSGQLKTPADITKDITCMWVVNLPELGDKGKPNIVQLQYERGLPALQTDMNYFEIRDGPNSDSPLVAYQDGSNKTEYRGDVLSVDEKVTVLSRTNQMFVTYVFRQSSERARERGFAFEMDYKLLTCDKQCKNGLCLHDKWRCDGIDQCGDNSDELGCLTPVPDCKGYRIHMVETWILGVSVAAAFIVAIITTLMALFTVKRCRSRNRDDDGSLLIQED